MIALAAALLSFAGLGALVDRALLRGWDSAGWGERLGRAWMLGFGSFGALSLALDAVGIGVTRASVAIAVTIVGAGLVIRMRRSAASVPVGAEGGVGALAGHDASLREPPSVSRTERWAVIGLLVLAALSLAIVVRSGWVRPTYQFDALTRWMFKAKALHLEGTLRGALSTDPHFWFTHQRYPALIVHVANVPALVSGEFDDRIASALFPWFAVSITLVLHGFLRRHAGALAAAVGAAWFATLPLVAWLENSPPGSGAFSAVADIPLSLFAMGAGFAAWRAAHSGSLRHLLEAGFLLACTSLTKNEGLAFAVVLPVAYALGARERRLRGSGVLLAVALALHFGLWGLRALSFPALDEHYAARLHADAVLDGLDRVPAIAAGVGAEFASLRNWNLTWFAVAALLFLGGRRSLAPGHRLLWLAFLGQLAAYTFALVVSDWTNPLVVEGEDAIGRLMHLTLGRLLLHVAPLALAAALLVAPLSGVREESRLEPAPAQR